MEIILEAKNISKSYPGVLAVDNVSLVLYKGEILALIGENGAGKSTLIQVLGGVQKPNSGQIILKGKPVVVFASSDQAIRVGISMVFQELSLVDGLSIAENIFANRQPVGMLNKIDWRKLYKQTQEFLEKFNLDLNPRTLVKNLTMGQKQILEILKAISTSPKVLILDEPTSALTEREREYLFENIRMLREQGMSFIYITHKLSEVFRIADRVMVMRDGKKIGSENVNDVNEKDLISMMVGRKIENLYGARKKAFSETETILRVEGFNRRNVFQDVSFELRKGEILGFAGLIGAGRTEVGRAIAGIDPKDSGRINLDGKEVKINNPKDAIIHNIAYITEDRKADGLFESMALRDNIVAPSVEKFTSVAGFLNHKEINQYADRKVRDFNIATTSIMKKVLYLSGGNQQKVLVTMWMGIQPIVIIFDDPTRGVDVGSKAEIYKILRETAARGVGIIMISSELPELIGVCDRILIFHRGRIMGGILRQDFSEERIMTLAAGIVNAERSHSTSSAR
ncbi:MAG: sugar ABC transporter ATP-binding protein [Anaerolineales bacterium]|nr:sugar ABC transporter ATP-binding protein [Anaerolineales bacterium]